MSLIFYEIMSIPFKISFDVEIDPTWDHLIDAVFLMDIIISFNTAFYFKGVPVRKITFTLGLQFKTSCNPLPQILVLDRSPCFIPLFRCHWIRANIVNSVDWWQYIIRINAQKKTGNLASKISFLAEVHLWFYYLECSDSFVSSKLSG
jgi:hypothetical protein